MPRRKNEDHVFSLESDFREPLAMLEKMGADKQKMMKSILKGVGTASKAPVRKAYRSEGLNKRTGVLYKSITRKVFRNGKAVIVAAYARNQKNIFYGYALAKGSEIKSKTDKPMKFQIGDKWVTTYGFKLKKHDFVTTPVSHYLTTPAFKAKLDELVQKEVTKIEKRKAQ